MSGLTYRGGETDIGSGEYWDQKGIPDAVDQPYLVEHTALHIYISMYVGVGWPVGMELPNVGPG